MPAPENATPEIYRLMLGEIQDFFSFKSSIELNVICIFSGCWSYEPEMRPHFDEIFTIVDSLANRE